MQKETVNKILSETKHGYDMVSKKFSETRKHFWRGLEFLGDYAKDGGTVLDYGCGNGRLLELIGNKDLTYLGLDISQQLLDQAVDRYGKEKIAFKKINPSQESLPRSSSYDKSLLRGIASPDASFNTIYSIAVFHHLPGAEYQKTLAKEMYRTLKPGGHVVITVWNLWQKKYYKKPFENWKKKILGKSNLGWNDCYISFTDNEGKKFHRYHHAFTKRELKKLFSEAGFKTEKCEVVDGRNIIFIGKKL